MSEYGLQISFVDQSETFVLGFEAGMFYQWIQREMQERGALFPFEERTIHTKNVEVFGRIVGHFGYFLESEPTDVDGWSTIRISRRRKLVSV